mmetsp:Transcript_23516/g.41340  ORF Transcript_23516/g.41340 Transcript_23516/m.41340 type:complete len:455 (+) Transcript_23516:50-1414(+)
MLQALALVQVLTLWHYTGALRPTEERQDEDGGRVTILGAANSSILRSQDGSLALGVHASARFEHELSAKRQTALVQVDAVSSSGPPTAAAHWSSFNIQDHEDPEAKRARGQLDSIESLTAESKQDAIRHIHTTASAQGASEQDGLADATKRESTSNAAPAKSGGSVPEQGTQQSADLPHQAGSASHQGGEAKQDESNQPVKQLPVDGAISAEEEHHEKNEPFHVEVDDPSAPKSATSPIDILLGVRADHAQFPDDGDTEVFSELDHAIYDIQEFTKVSFQIYDRFARFTESLVCRNWLVAAVVYASGMFLMLGLYSLFFRYRDVESDQDFSFGLLDCMGDVRICIYGIACAPIRWADTMHKAGVANFLPAFFIMWLLLTLRIVLFHFFSWGCLAWLNVSIVGAFFRQKIRKRCALEESTPQSYIEDFFAWCCCAEFAVCQEARQMEAVLQQDAF